MEIRYYNRSFNLPRLSLATNVAFDHRSNFGFTINIIVIVIILLHSFSGFQSLYSNTGWYPQNSYQLVKSNIISKFQISTYVHSIIRCDFLRNNFFIPRALNTQSYPAQISEHLSYVPKRKTIDPVIYNAK